MSVFQTKICSDQVYANKDNCERFGIPDSETRRHDPTMSGALTAQIEVSVTDLFDDLVLLKIDATTATGSSAADTIRFNVPDASLEGPLTSVKQYSSGIYRVGAAGSETLETFVLQFDPLGPGLGCDITISAQGVNPANFPNPVDTLQLFKGNHFFSKMTPI